MSDDPAPAHLGFSFRVTRQGEVEINHRGRKATTLRGSDAADFLAEAGKDGDAIDAQQLMARLTGNYKRGNERLASQHPRNRR